MGRNSYSPNGELKLCTGPLHKRGVWLPISHFQKLTPTKKNPQLYRSQCNPCWRYMKHYRDPAYSRLVASEEFQPCIDYAVSRLGSKRAVCRAMGYNHGALSNYGHYERMKGSKFFRLMELVDELEKADPEIIQNGWQTTDPLVVDGLLLREILLSWERNFLRRYDMERPSATPVGGAYGSTSFISAKSNVSNRYISELKSGRMRNVPVGQADKILAAIDREDVLDTHELPVFKNPLWPMRKWLQRMRDLGVFAT